MGRYVYVATRKGASKPSPSQNTMSPKQFMAATSSASPIPKFQKICRPPPPAFRHRRSPRQHSRYSGPRRIRLRSQWARRPARLRHRQYRQQGFLRAVVTSPVSPIGQRFYVPTKNALAVASPSTLAIDPLRTRFPENEEQSIHLLYGFLYVADKEEGLVIVGNPDLHSKSPGVGTLLDGNPANNFLHRAAAFNPGGVLTGAKRITIAGTFAYILTDKSLVVVDLEQSARATRHRHHRRAGARRSPGIAVQFRYAFVVDRQGLKVLDVTDLAQPKPVANALVPLRRRPQHLHRPHLRLRLRRKTRRRHHRRGKT